MSTVEELRLSTAIINGLNFEHLPVASSYLDRLAAFVGQLPLIALLKLLIYTIMDAAGTVDDDVVRLAERTSVAAGCKAHVRISRMVVDYCMGPAIAPYFKCGSSTALTDFPCNSQ